MDKIPFIKPKFPTAENLINDYLIINDNNFYTNSGPFEKTFESSIDKFVGNNIRSSVIANATLGLILAIKALTNENDKKKEILIQSFTFAAGMEAIIWCGFSPVLMDIDENWQANIEQAKDYLEHNHDKVAGILLCNTFGVGNKDINAWESLSSKHTTPLIIDSAAGFGSSYKKDEVLGSRGDCEIFSLHATKPFAVGEGGIVTSKNHELISLINKMKNFGFNEKREVDLIGLNAKAPEITSAIGIRQLVGYKEKIHNRQELLKKVKGKVPFEIGEFQKNDEFSTVPFVSIKLFDMDISAITGKYSKQGIDVRNYYNPPLHKHPIFEKYKKLDLTQTEYLSNRILSLPLHDDFIDLDITRITNILKE